MIGHPPILEGTAPGPLALRRLRARASGLARAETPGAAARGALAQAGGFLASGLAPEAIRLCQAVLWDHPGFAEAWTLLGMSLEAEGQAAESLRCHKLAMRLAPGAAQGQHMLAQALWRAGEAVAAERAAEAAVMADPALARAWFLLGALRNARGAAREALAAHGEAIRLVPEMAAAHLGLGNAHRALRAPSEAAAAYRAALAGDPDRAEAWSNLGCVLHEMGLLDEAIPALREAVARDPGLVEAWRNLGAALHTQGMFAEAIDAFAAALARAPADAELLGYMATALSDLGDPETAEALFAQAVAIAPENADLRFNRGLSRLKAGDWETGWAEHEWRWRGVMPPHGIDRPRWRGEALRGETVMLHAEQGLGDTLHFVRYAPLVAARGGRVILEVQAPLVRLLGAMPGVARVIAVGEARGNFDLHCPLMSLPHAFGTRPGTVPAAPYLAPPGDARARWAEIAKDLPPRAAGRRVGLVWAGGPRPEQPRSHYVDRRRSLALAQLEPVLRTPGCVWVSLQLGAAAGQVAQNGAPIVDLTAEIGDFADTAALLEHLDAVVAVDTSTAHLAGGMGVPTFLLSRADGCWRWGMQEERTPWYPGMRLFRQREAGDWREAVEGVARALGEWIDTKPPFASS